MKAHLLMNSEGQDTLFEDIGSQVSSLPKAGRGCLQFRAASRVKTSLVPNLETVFFGIFQTLNERLTFEQSVTR